MQGARHLIWDMIILEVSRISPHLKYIQDKEMVINESKQSCTTMNEALNIKPIDIIINTTNFLNTLSKEELREMGIKYRIAVITWVGKVVWKH